MADTVRHGSVKGPPKVAGDRTDPEVVVAPTPPLVQPPFQQAVTQMMQSRPIDVSAPVSSDPIPNLATTVGPSRLHEDPTTMRPAHRTVQRPSQAGPGPSTVRVEPSVVAEAMERPKIWVATHKAPPDPDPRLILVREPDSARAASFRVLRHRLVDRGDPRIIAVTSPGARDGKTTCAANLALALCEFGRAKVLLVEANLRNPQVAVLFGFLPPECFSVQLQRHRERPLDPWSVVEAFSPSLHVLAVKPGEANRPLLDSPAMSIAVEMLSRGGYDFIVFDTPPVLGSADVNLIEDYVDGFIVAARSGRTQGRDLRAAVEQLSPQKLLGVALIDA